MLLKAAFIFCFILAGGFAAAKPPVILVSVEPQAYFVERLAGGAVKAVALVEKGANPHLFEPAISQLSLVASAAAYFKVGHPLFAFEAQWEERARAEKPDLLVVDTSSGIAERGDDPHLWLVPSHVRIMCRNMAEALTALLPAQAQDIEENRRRFENEIDETDRTIRALLADVRGGKFFVFHPAWGHFAREYGLIQAAIEREGKEPDARTIAEVIADGRANGVKTIFIEPQFSEESARVIAAELGARTEVLDPQARDWKENVLQSAAKIHEALKAQKSAAGNAPQG